ncbi:SDR family NAD(P)-dependent oxidoreductase [Actinophytocola algeriensis]|uniref:NAD(P)-dependent dehydrogenase (Short-subunit alcohol dehydrogenase family) n=1 Tax=Actinophytocola algeriensis TaxID=1768010 RepID=A0A7W7Q178_9PSEU|nr:SDR family oxidoreductase [Actinophytocola algeriensis]MBB4905077.1 NAD(P)-dependent dehydrogenase (short-subunit alcohol dehydrogenase family) [Actinophytocola algeriensis]MBE1473238.1 NAD(P)-dependent dehydrogenase (short-subunit alcohol dehydrogenase family) [Actinophytocola algeriensis]
MRLLEDRAVIVTGAGRGLGRAYALDLAAAGASVVVNDVDATEARAVVDEVGAAGGSAVASGHDVSDPDAVDALVATCVTAFGRLDGLVNNAGIYHEARPWDERPDTMHRAVLVNVLGALQCQAAASAVMRDGGGGAIVNASSGGMFGFPSVSTYAATKGALAALTYSSALDLEAAGIRVNAISPMALTRMTENALGRDLAPSTQDAPPLAGIDGKLPEAVAPLVTFLLSDLADGITGQFLRFDGHRVSVVTTDPFADHPHASADRWTPQAMAAAFLGPLGPHLQPYGVERRLPPRLRVRP